MFRLFIYLLITPNLMSKVMSEILCKDSRIDSITYANDIQMYFFTSGGMYWWIKENEFPPKDKDAKPLPKPFVMGQAAVYVDTDNGCVNSRSDTGIKPLEKDIWVEEYVGGDHKIMAFDTKLGNWRGEAISYRKDHCISRARIDWASGKPLDAMFVRNYLEIYFVQDTNYAMVDCNYICNDPNNFGDDKKQYNVTDFHTVDPIYGMFVRKNKVLFMFHEKTFYEMTIEPSLSVGKLETIKGTLEKSLIKDFMKIDNPGQCLTTTPTPKQLEEKPNEPKEEVPKPVQEPTGTDATSGNNTLLKILGALAVLVIIIIICVLVFFAMRRKSKPNEEEANEKATKEKTSVKAQSVSDKSAPKPAGASAAAPPASGVATNPKTGSNVKNASTITQKSNIGAVGIASKSSVKK